MAALKLDMTIPLGDAGHVHLVIDITDLDQLTPQQRQVLADTGAEFYAFAAATIAPQTTPDELPPATIHDPSASILNGITGSRRQ